MQQPMRFALWFVVGWGFFGNVAVAVAADGPTSDLIAADLNKLNATVLPKDPNASWSGMLGRYFSAELQAANARSTQAWRTLNAETWPEFRAEKLRLLRESLGVWPTAATPLNVRTTRTLEGDGFAVENVVYESRPGVLVTGNLYKPRPARETKGPALLLVHSHHAAKHSGELQDMGMTWARRGCVVLVIDQLGYGERRLHPFATAADFPRPFQPDRQSYYFRYDSSLQLYLLGDSLMGWMVWDLLRGVDVLAARPEVDATRLGILGGVAGGGDPCAVAGALDERLNVVGPFNFGGPQPETKYPLPENAETSFGYAGSGSWESTRNLRFSARDGFLPWVIVGSIAPRRHIYGHEFSWDRPRDPVWKRLETIHGFTPGTTSLGAAHGAGTLQGEAPASTHCGHIGQPHREMIHPLLAQWWKIDVTAAHEYSRRLEGADLRALPSGCGAETLAAMGQLAEERLAAARAKRAALPANERLNSLQHDLTLLLGEPAESKRELTVQPAETLSSGVQAQRCILEVQSPAEARIVIPLLVLLPAGTAPAAGWPVVVAVSQQGKDVFLRERSNDLAQLLAGGVAVALPDVRGVGETAADRERDFRGAASSHSASQLMLGRSLLAARLGDLKRVIATLHNRRVFPQLNSNRLALWGDSFAAPNAEQEFIVPRRIDGRPQNCEPLGAMLALLAAIDNVNIRGVVASGGLASFRETLESPVVYFPHDVILPGLFTAGDIDDLAAALAPRKLALVNVVDKFNRAIPPAAHPARFPLTTAAYAAQKANVMWSTAESDRPADLLRKWLGVTQVGPGK